MAGERRHINIFMIWRRLIDSVLVRRFAIGAGVALVIALILAFIYFSLLPKLAYRNIVFDILPDGAVTSATVTKNGETQELNDMQILAVVSWLAGYRSENLGFAHASESEGAELTLTLSSGQVIPLVIEPGAVVFDGFLGPFRLRVDNNEIYTLINNLNDF